MGDEIREKYPPRKTEDMIDITKLLVGISSDGVSTDWIILEKTDEPKHYKDILTESEYIIEDDGTVIISRMSPDALYKDDDVRKMKTFTGAKTIREILEETSKFFYGLELNGYKKEIDKLRELHTKLLAIYKHIDNGQTFNVSVGDLDDSWENIFNVYTYAFGNPIDKNLSVECYDIKQRPLFDMADINDICMANIKRENANIPVILEKTNKGFSYKDRKIDIYKDILYDTYYYVLENGEMYTSSSELITRSRILSEFEKEYFIDIVSLEDAVDLTIKSVKPEETQIDMDVIFWMKNLFDSAKKGDPKIMFPLIELRDSEALLLNIYKKALENGETLVDPNNIVGNISIISDIVSNMAYTLKK